MGLHKELPVTDAMWHTWNIFTISVFHDLERLLQNGVEIYFIGLLQTSVIYYALCCVPMI